MVFLQKKKTNKNRKECSVHNCNMLLASMLTMIMITQNSICIFPQYVSASFQYFNRGKKRDSVGHGWIFDSFTAFVWGWGGVGD